LLSCLCFRSHDFVFLLTKDDQETESLTEWLRESLTVAAPVTRLASISDWPSVQEFSFTPRFSDVQTLGHDDYSRFNGFHKNGYLDFGWAISHLAEAMCE
jgi:hypothetical protein